MTSRGQVKNKRVTYKQEYQEMCRIYTIEMEKLRRENSLLSKQRELAQKEQCDLIQYAANINKGHRRDKALCFIVGFVIGVCFIITMGSI